MRQARPDLDPSWIVIEPGLSFAALMQSLTPVGTVVATRYHNVICALKLGKPTIALGYAEKFGPLMADMGLAEFTESASSFNINRSSSGSPN